MEDRMSWIEAGRKRPRLEEKVATSLVKFRGVLPQQNGNWGAQIYANHQRIWLGTFRTERDAAMAYDSAAIKLRRDDHHSQRNFPWTQQNVHELVFQSVLTEEEILDMIRDGTYQSKFTNFLKNQSENSGILATPQKRLLLQLQCDRQILCRQLFQKELTPSDVGKLNRLVIPKKYAVRYFPSIKENETGTLEGSRSYTDDTQLVFHDRVMKTWKFRYCYWRSSQSFVFTRGWNRFVKEKDLRAKDVVTFYGCEYTKRPNGEETFCLIDVNYNNGEGSIGNENDEHIDERNHNVELRLNLGNGCSFGSNGDGDEEKFKEEHNEVRLFGVQIN